MDKLFQFHRMQMAEPFIATARPLDGAILIYFLNVFGFLFLSCDRTG